MILVAEIQKVNMFKVKCLRIMVGVIRKERVRNVVIPKNTGVKTKIALRVDRSVLR